MIKQLLFIASDYFCVQNQYFTYLSAFKNGSADPHDGGGPGYLHSGLICMTVVGLTTCTLA